jgi:phage terminase small subunit
MVKTGRENPQSMEITPLFGADRRLRPPDSLPDDAQRVFSEVVSSHASGHFKASDLSVLGRYCELVALAERSACELARDGVVLPDGSLSKWFQVHSTVTKQITILAGRLRIGPSSRTRQQSKKQVEPMSYYDRMKLKPGWDKFDD